MKLITKYIDRLSSTIENSCEDLEWWIQHWRISIGAFYIVWASHALKNLSTIYLVAGVTRSIIMLYRILRIIHP